MKKAIYYLLIVFVLFSCTPKVTETEKQEVLETVKRYNELLRRAYLEANLGLMRDIVTNKHLNNLFPVINSLLATGNSMIALQESFKVKGIRVSEDTAFVEAEEQWTYWWQNRRTGQITKPRQTILYRLRYKLIYDEGGWKIDEITEVK